jgi:sphingolipid C9-methyltransferase
VGIKNLNKFCRQIYSLLKDDGLFLLQWVGLRRGGKEGVPIVGLRPEDLIWGLFMNKYIFSGADASLPLSDMTLALEKAGFQIQSVENISIHYALTIKRWHDNWQKHRPAVLKAYGERWFRLWHLFLGWSWRIAAQGTGQGFQLVAHKNLNSFDRTVFIGKSQFGAQHATGHHYGDPARAPVAARNGKAHVADAE